jgi:SAM-dependent methyltransferase
MPPDLVAPSGVTPDPENGLAYVQYGCGLCAPHRWVNFDASPRLRLERMQLVKAIVRISVGMLFAPDVRYGDIVAGLPIPDAVAAGVYCSHVLEHLPRADIAVALLETKRILRPGGTFRLVIPDLYWRAQQYVTAVQAADPHAADRFLDSCMLGTRSKAQGFLEIASRHYSLNAHKWMYDFAIMRDLLQTAGFIGIRRCQLGDSPDPMFALVEDAGRFSECDQKELAIEARKPARSRQSEQASKTNAQAVDRQPAFSTDQCG